MHYSSTCTRTRNLNNEIQRIRESRLFAPRPAANSITEYIPGKYNTEDAKVPFANKQLFNTTRSQPWKTLRQSSYLNRANFQIFRETCPSEMKRRYVRYQPRVVTSRKIEDSRNYKALCTFFILYRELVESIAQKCVLRSFFVSFLGEGNRLKRSIRGRGSQSLRSLKNINQS